MKTNVLMILAAGLMLGACSNDNEPVDNSNGVAAVFTTNLDGRVQTRMADQAWAAGDAIGIFSSDEMSGVAPVEGMVASNKAVNLKYNRTTDNTWDGGSTAFRFKNPASSDVTFKAYYPYQESVTDENGTITFNATPQTAQAQADFDFLFADKDAPTGGTPTGSKNSPMVNFQFAHSMAKVVIVLEPDGTSVTALGDMNPTLKGLIASGSFSLADGIAQATGTATTDLELKNQTEPEASKASRQSFVAIVPPQAKPAAAYLTIYSGSDNYLSAEILNTALVAGNCYTVQIKVRKMELVVNGSDITAWQVNPLGSSDAILQ